MILSYIHKKFQSKEKAENLTCVDSALANFGKFCHLWSSKLFLDSLPLDDRD